MASFEEISRLLLLSCAGKAKEPDELRHAIVAATEGARNTLDLINAVQGLVHDYEAYLFFLDANNGDQAPVESLLVDMLDRVEQIRRDCEADSGWRHKHAN